MSRRLAPTLLATMTVIVTNLAATPSAAALSGDQFNGTNPLSTGCASDAFTYYSAPLRDPRSGAELGSMELRFSRTCKTNWVRVNNPVAGATAVKIISRPGEGGYSAYSQTENDTLTGWTYGMQVYAPAGVCVDIGGVIRDGSAVLANNGQGLTRVC